ncbi:MAG: DNA polymerase III subunit gamma/tau [Dehalococcoidia bacterium]
MPTEVLYRKWRPQRFADVAGQEILTRTLVNALAGHKVSHAYLFSGPRGTGKTTTGRLLAKAVNCERNAPDAAHSPGEPCNECASCRAFAEGRTLAMVELDAASNRGIDEIRELREKANYFVTEGGRETRKVYLIDEVHMLTDPAFNALLKTLEEPPPHVLFVLATTDAHRVPATIVSRCQRFDFKRIPLSAMTGRLAHIAEQEGLALPKKGLELISRSATGSLRDAINLLEQVCDTYGPEPSLEAVREGLGLVSDERAGELAAQTVRGDLAGGLGTIGAVRDDGLDLRQFQKEVVLRLRELLLVQSGADAGDALTAEQVAALRATLDGVPRERLILALKLFGLADLRADPLSPLPLELALAETVAEPAAPLRAASPEPQQARSAPAPAPAARSAPRPAPPAGRPAAERPAVPEGLRRDDLKDASAEQIAAMLGSKEPVIPAASENGESEAAPAAAPAADGALATLVDRLRAEARKHSVKLDALLNGSCHAVSWEGGVLTLGFYDDAFQKKNVEQAENRRVYEQVATELLGAPATIRCIIAPRPQRKAASSTLVQHAVNRGAKVVSED